MKVLKRLGNNKVKNKINRNWFDSFYILEYYKLINNHYYCYRDETIGDVYLESCNQDERCLSERLYDIYKLLPEESLFYTNPTIQCTI